MNTSTRLAKGTKVRYRQNTRMARGGSWTTRTTWGTIVGTYGEKYLISTRWGNRTTRQSADDVLEVLNEWPAR